MYQLTNTLLSINNVSLSFGENKILRDINLEVKDIVREQTTGQVITLLGRSGVGKTQLMQIIAGLNSPTTGEVLVGRDQKKVTPGIVGMVLQTYPLFQHRTLLSNLLLVNKDKEKIDFFLNEFDLFDKKQHYPKKLSGGQKQRVAIIQQLLCSEHFVLLDEPFSGLDPVATEKLCKNISKIANFQEENTIIISSHILEPALAISDEIWMLGHEYNNNEKIPGATIVYKEDLAAKGLAWNPEIRKNPHFTEVVENIRQHFQTI